MSLHREPLRAVPPPRPLPFLPPALATLRLPDNLADSLTAAAPSLAGMLFGAGWFAFLDGVLTATARATPLAALPGALATAALLLTATVNRADLEDGGAGGPVFDAGGGAPCGARGVTFTALMLSYGAAGAGVALLLLGRVGGWAIVQVCCILSAAGLLFAAGGEGGGGGYSAF
jgi:hypothetical protein